MRDVRAHAWSPVVLVALCVMLGLQGQAQQQAPRASDLLQELTARDSQVSVTWNERENIPRSLIGRLTQSSGAPARQVALEFVRRNGSLFGLVDPERELQLVREESDRLGITHLRFAQIHEGVPVFGSEMRVHVNAAGIVSGVQAELLPGIAVSAEPGIGPEVGLQMARSHAGDSAARGASTLVIFDRGRLPRGPRQDRLAWQVTLRSGPAGEWVYFVDAVDGNVLFRYTTRHDARFRVVYSYHMGAECDLGQLLYVENGPVVPNPGQAATSAHQFTGDFYDYYWSTHGRDGYDDAGSHMVSVVGLASGAAYYSPGCEATYYENAYVTKDVVAHEWQHAVTQFTANLVFSCEPGALNESMSDVFAAMVDRDDWLIGEDLPGGYIRSLADPTASQQPQPDTTSGFNPCAGVHHNSGIPNKVAYLVAEGGTHYGVVVTGSDAIGSRRSGIGRSGSIWARIPILRALETRPFWPPALYTVPGVERSAPFRVLGRPSLWASRVQPRLHHPRRAIPSAFGH
jgi:bacillolysin